LRILVESKGSKDVINNPGYMATINLVDLAGSECANYNINGSQGQRMETSYINKVFFRKYLIK